MLWYYINNTWLTMNFSGKQSALPLSQLCVIYIVPYNLFINIVEEVLWVFSYEPSIISIYSINTLPIIIWIYIYIINMSFHPPVFSRVRGTRSLVLCACFVDRYLSFCTYFGHSVVCSSSIYGFSLPLWYL